jgi:peptide/nickel transport system ATP-binding protein
MSTTLEAPAATAPLVTISDVEKYFKVRGANGKSQMIHALDDINLDIYPGEVVGLVGESGSGKSTLARVLLKLIEADSGEVVVDGMDTKKVRGLKKVRKLRKSAQMVFQDPHASMDPLVSIGDSLSLVLRQHKLVPKDQQERTVIQALEDVGLDATYLHRLPSECSGGQLQRVVIARALLLDPKLLVCDEPTSALDASVQAKVLNLLMRLMRERELTMLFVSHDLRVIRLMADRIAVMFHGKIMELGTTEQIMERPEHEYTQLLISCSGLFPEQESDPLGACMPDTTQFSLEPTQREVNGRSVGGTYQLVELERDPGHFVRSWVPDKLTKA